MPRCSIFIPLLLLFLPGVSPYCYTAPAQKCSEKIMLVPGQQLLGQCIDVTTLQWKEVSLADTSEWRDSNGTCTLCQNSVQGGQWQKVPLAVMDWKEHIECNREIKKFVEESAVAVAQAVASAVKNDWKKELELTDESQSLALGGSRSPFARFAYEKEQQDKYMFVLFDMPCVYYRSRLPHDPPLTQHFSRALHNLPTTYSRNAYQSFLASYGTHYVSQADLGGRVQQVRAIPTCQVVLDGLTSSKIKDCLGSHFMQALGLSSRSSSSQYCSQSSQSSQSLQGEKHIDVTGGNTYTKEQFSKKQDTTTFSAWLESLKASPGLVSYSLVPIHTLLGLEDPRREALRQAVKEYVAERGQKRNCPSHCPKGGNFDSLDPCKCSCSGNPLTDSKCCSRQRGLAQLKVQVLSGTGLWGDPSSGTDAYVKVFFRNGMMKTDYIQDNNDPEWNTELDFGMITLEAQATPKVTVEVWDTDSWPWWDHSLGSCNTDLRTDGDTFFRCNLDYGHVTISYSLECGPNLRGKNCQEYVPVTGYGERTQEF